MHLLLADESNRNPSDRIRYFIYGGTIIDCARLLEVHEFLERLRETYGISPGWDLKFDTAYRPVTISADTFAEIKNEILQAARGWNIRFMAYVVHHRVVDVRRKRDRAFRLAMNTILYTFNCYLRNNNTHGQFIVDRFDGAACLDMVKTIFTGGLDLPPRNARRAINRVCFMGASCVGASHLMSLLDIVLGAFRFCVNASRDQMGVARLLYNSIRPLILTSPTGQTEEWGLFIRPQNIRAPQLIPEYQALREHLDQLAAS